LRNSVHIAIGCALAVLAGLGSGCSRGNPAQAQGAAPKQPIKVRVAQVRTQAIDRRVETVGTLFADQEVTVSSEVEGRVAEVLVDLGDRVQKGRALATIVPDEQKYNLAQQEAQLRQALARLGLQNEEDRVADINQVPDVKKAIADLQEAEQRFRRVKELVAQNVASAQDLDQAESRYKALQATLDVTRHQVQNLIGLVSQYKASVALARKRLSDTAVRAPFDGAIRQRLAEVGQYMRPQAPMFELVKIDQLRLRAEVPEKMAPWVKVGNTVELQVEAHPGRVFQGRVSRISPAVDEQKRTFAIEALIPNAESLLRPGFYTKAAIVTERKEAVLTIPSDAVLYAYGTNKAFVVDGGKALARELKLGERVGNEVEVVQGLRSEDKVALNDLERLDNGTPVQVQGN
jgi:RND family efflux transporter MFP subunit